MKVYLSHPHSIRSFGRVVQQRLESVGFDVINPFDVNPEEEWWAAVREQRNMLSVAFRIVENDLELIRDCDAVVVLYPEAHGIGTDMELFYAGVIVGKPVYVLTAMDHPWLLYCGVCVRSVDELVKVLLRRSR